MRWRHLWLPDDPRWALDARYVSDLAAALRAVFARVAPPATAGPQEHLDACSGVARWLDRPVCARQRVRICFLLARTHEQEGDNARAVELVDDALVVAARAHLTRELAELLGYHGQLQRAREKLRAASDDLEASLALLAAHAKSEEAIDPELRLALLAQLATYAYFLATPRAAMRHARQARRLFPRAPALTQEAAAILWVEAHLDRTRGLPERALRLALNAQDLYTRGASPSTRDRIETFVAELALDLVCASPGGAGSPAGQSFLRLARASLGRAERLARAADDPPGLGLIQLAHARESRLRAHNEDRRTAIERVIRLAERRDDEGLLAQALTTPGDEYASLGEEGPASNRYRAALDVLAGSEVPALAVVPRRALLRANPLDRPEW